MTSNYLTLPYEDRIARVNLLQVMRAEVLKVSRAVRAAKPRREKKRKMVFFSEEIEKLFESMGEDAQKFIRNGR